VGDYDRTVVKGNYRRDDVLIVQANNGDPHYVEMSEVSVEYIKKQRYNYQSIQFGGNHYNKYPMHMKAAAIKGAFASSSAKWVVWTDVDSVMVGSIDELFEGDYDFGCPRKELGAVHSRQHGSYLYAGLMVFQRGPGTDWLLNELGENPHVSDQLRLHEVLQSQIPLDSVEAGQVYQIDQCKVKIFDQDKYFHMTALREMRRWDEGVKVLHFKGGLHKKGTWARYKEKFL